MTWVDVIQPTIRLPVFIFAIGVFYFSFPILVIINKIKWYDFKNLRGDSFIWSEFLTKFFRVKLYKVKGTQILRTNRLAYLPNHRGFGDFFLDQYISGGSTIMLSRNMVALVFPLVVFTANQIKGCYLFNREKIQDHQKFNKSLDEFWDESPYQALLLYPEGHRNTKLQSLPLKRGLLRFCYERKIPVQVVIAKNKDDIISEKEFKLYFGVKVKIGFSEPIDPKKYDEFETFFKEVQRSWDYWWDLIYYQKDVEYEPYYPEPQYFPMKKNTRIIFSALTLSGVAFMFLFGTLLIFALRYALVLTLKYKILFYLVTPALLVICSLSFYNAFNWRDRPVERFAQMTQRSLNKKTK